jgi:hypothetical protein
VVDPEREPHPLERVERRCAARRVRPDANSPPRGPCPHDRAGAVVVERACENAVNAAHDAVAPGARKAVRTGRHDERLAFDRLGWPRADG